MIDLKIDALRMDVLLREIGADEKQMQRALRSTVSKLSAWIRTRAGRGIRQDTGLKNAHLRRRLKAIKLKKAPNGVAGGLWLGLNPIDLKYLAPEQTGKGVTAGPPGRGAAYKSAFMGPRPGQVASKLKGRVFVRKGKARLPVEKVGMPIASQAERVLESGVINAAQFEQQFFKVLEHELKWRTQQKA